MRAVIWLAVALTGASPAAGQAAATLIGTARTHLDAGRYADAARLLQMAVLPAANATREEKLEAFVLLGVAEFESGHDSLARAAFREALAIDPGFEAEGLAEVDPRLPALLAEVRASARGPGPERAGPPPTPQAGPTVYECLPRCVAVEDPPRLLTMPRIVIPDGMHPIGQPLRIVAEVVIDTAGQVERGSAKLTFVNARGVEADVMEGLRQMRFRPARAGGRPVRVHVELTFGPRWLRTTLLVGRPADPQ